MFHLPTFELGSELRESALSRTSKDHLRLDRLLTGTPHVPRGRETGGRTKEGRVWRDPLPGKDDGRPGVDLIHYGTPLHLPRLQTRGSVAERQK